MHTTFFVWREIFLLLWFLFVSLLAWFLFFSFILLGLDQVGFSFVTESLCLLD